ncbi:MAG: phosphoribosyltransferase [Firmicutes bacterium]|nr:phosphoribosyltransferase [Alicyclobacillaceae bacterium]MCL6498061.1 phosphoribosyltransferase [Bacillota bacterium]
MVREGSALPFADRAVAGERLGQWLAEAGIKPGLVVAIPRGGVPVAAPVARRFKVPLSLAPVRKLGHPLEPELAVGAVDADGEVVWHPEWPWARRDMTAQVAEAVAAARAVAQRWAAYLPGPEAFAGDEVVVVDDGLATGLSLRAAVGWVVRRAQAAGLAPAVEAAVPVAAKAALAALARYGVRVFALETLDPLGAVGQAYRDFHPVTEAEMAAVLEALSR